MSRTSSPDVIRIGLLGAEPIRNAGLASIFDKRTQQGRRQLVPVIGSLPELLSLANIQCIVVDVQSAPGGFEALEIAFNARPDVRLIAIGPEDDDELALRAIIVGARAYLGPSAGPETIARVIEVVISGSIWAPRRVQSDLIDGLLRVSRRAPAVTNPRLTLREQQVLELLLEARSTQEIASQLGIERGTVKGHVGRLMRKTGSENRVKLSMSALKHSLLPQQEGRNSGSAERRDHVTK